MVHFNGLQTKFIVDSLYKHPVHRFFLVAAVADEDGSARGEDHAEDNHDGEEDEGA